MVKYYIANLLVDGPEDENKITGFEKEAWKKREQAQTKKGDRRGGGGK